MSAAGEIDDVIDVVPVSRPLPAPDARERAVEAVAEPIDGQGEDVDGCRPERDAHCRERRAAGDHRRKR